MVAREDELFPVPLSSLYLFAKHTEQSVYKDIKEKARCPVYILNEEKLAQFQPLPNSLVSVSKPPSMTALITAIVTTINNHYLLLRLLCD